MASIDIYPGYEKVLSFFSDYQFKKALEVFGGKGNITEFLSGKVKRVTSIDSNVDYQDIVDKFPNVNFIPYDSLKLVKETYTTQRYDIVDIDCDTQWTGLGSNRNEFYSFMPEVIMMCKKILALTFITDPKGLRYRDYAQFCQAQTISDAMYFALLDKLLEERINFWETEPTGNKIIQDVMNREANKVDKKAELILHDKYCPTHSRLYLLIQDL